ncbi:hypothetical protein [Flavobacterium terrae]|nr:hypothetical protein [Flavobacterium terrae]
MSCKTNDEILKKEYLDYQFIKGMEMPKTDGYQYSEKCFLIYSQYKFLTEKIFKYDNGILKEYVYCGPEGPDVRDYNVEKYSKNKLIYSKQKLIENQDKLVFNKIEYYIKRRLKDTIVAENKEETILVIINAN